MQKICSGCSGSLIREGNYLVCEYCHRKELIDVSDDLHAVARANAWESLRKSDFDKATELFEELVIKNPKDYDSNWGLALAHASIVYVNDVSENKKVPTCNNISENSFVEDKNVKNAILYAPKEIGESYKSHAKYIEKVRIEWLEKASKEPQYDVFISFKDSDRERGIERTSDSQTMQDLYTALVEKGYRVFYSRVSLRGKVSEQYEPYIYNALKTAKVMIVYGEKAEYFNSTWIKNEWSRYKKRIEQGEKHKNSLVVVYKGVNPYDIPVALTGGRQALDYSVPSNYELLMNHIKKIIGENQQAKGLDKIEIKGGQIGKKSSLLINDSLKTKDVGKGFAVETSINEKQQLSLVKTYIQEKMWDGAQRIVTDLLANNFNLGEAIWYDYLISHQFTGFKDFATFAYDLTKKDIDILKRILECSQEKFAQEMLLGLCDIICNKDTMEKERICYDLLNIILPYNFEKRDIFIDRLFKISIEKRWMLIFNLLISTLKSDEVDRYVELHLSFAKNSNLYEEKKGCALKALSVDEGNVEVLEFLYKTELVTDKLNDAIKYFELYLKYSKDVQDSLKETFKYFAQSLSRITSAEFVLQALKYYTDSLISIKKELVEIAYRMIQYGIFGKAQALLELVNSQVENNVDVYWGLILVKAGVKSEKELITCKFSIFEEPEFDKYLALVDENRRHECLELKRRRGKHFEDLKFREARAIKEIKRKIFTLVGIVVLMVVSIIFMLKFFSATGAYETKTIDTIIEKITQSLNAELMVIVIVFLVLGAVSLGVQGLLASHFNEDSFVHEEDNIGNTIVAYIGAFLLGVIGLPVTIVRSIILIVKIVRDDV